MNLKMNKCIKEDFVVIGKEGSTNDGNDTFFNMISYLTENHITLAGAVHEYTNPSTGKGYLYFPIKRL